MAEKKRFEQLLRPAYEARSAVGWGIACLWMLGITVAFHADKPALLACAVLALLMSSWRGLRASKLLRYKMALTGKPTVIMPAARMQAAMPKMGSNLWLGWGYRWEPRHTQRAYEIMKRDLDEVYPPKWWLKWAGIKTDPRQAKGLPWIHGLDMGEKDVTLPFDSLKGHCAIIATTGAIKTRLAALIIFQLALRGDCVIVIDPKGDKDLREICRQAAVLSGNPGRFLMLHPAFASTSVRLDLIKNWDRVSQVASRITMVLDSQESDNFKEFCWMAVHRITNAMKYIGQRVSIHTLKTAMESRMAVEHLTTKALQKFFAEECPQLAETLERQINALAATANKPQKGGIETSSIELAGMIKVFQEVVPEQEEQARLQNLPVKPEELRGLIAILEANREWFGKMIVSITPMLIQQANKGRGAGFFIWALGQTFSDLVDKFSGNTARAKRFIGNMNNLIIGATQDPDTMALIIDKLGETTITVRGQSVGIGSKTEDVGLEFSANSSTSISEKDKEIFPRSLLPSLPDLHYIGFFNRGELVKGRIPVLVAQNKA